MGKIGGDWRRGSRGWGSAAAAPGGYACKFQQDPLRVTDTAPENRTPEEEQDEAAADMFLNWVYSKVAATRATPIPTPTARSYNNYGFVDTDWGGVTDCDQGGTPDPTDQGGKARYTYLSTALPFLAGQFPTMTATP
jgi:hypothetical protein